MRVLIITIGDVNVPSSRVRALQYIPYLEKNGIECTHLQFRKGYYLKYQTQGTSINPLNWIFIKILTIILKGYDYLIYSKLRIANIFFICKKYDLVFIQKVVLPSFLIKRIKSKCKIVFDFDDAIYAKPHLFTRDQFKNQVIDSNIVIVTNNDAKQYVKKLGGDHIEIVIGPIDCKKYRSLGTSPDKTKFNIGWIGSQSSLHYLDIIRKPLKILSAKYPGRICLHVIGVENIMFEDIETITYRWDPKTEVQILDTFDVGIMPLKEDEFTRGKGGYKLLQYMSMSKANVSSPVGVNSWLVKNSVTGLLADTEKEWVECLELYYNNCQLRKVHGEKARELIINEYSLERWSNYLTSFLKNQ